MDLHYSYRPPARLVHATPRYEGIAAVLQLFQDPVRASPADDQEISQFFGDKMAVLEALDEIVYFGRC
jgi:hypothetical protein